MRPQPDPPVRSPKVRLAGPLSSGQRYGQAAGERLSRRAGGCFALVDWHSRGGYGRIMGKVLLSGRDVGLDQIEAGLGWRGRRFQDGRTAKEREAREAKRGLWADHEPMPPSVGIPR